MPPCIEVLKAPATQAYLDEGPKVAQTAIDIVSSVPGSLSTHTGPQIQDPGYWYVVNAWKTLKHHQDLIDNKPLYKELGDSLFKAAKGVEFLYHVNINTEDPYPAFNAPVTEIAIWTLKEGTDKAAA